MKTLGKSLYSEDIPEVFHSCELLKESSWSDYEEFGWTVIFDFFGEIMFFEYSYSVFAEDNRVVFDPYPITKEKLVSFQEDME